jgi:hypothetical protein
MVLPIRGPFEKSASKFVPIPTGGNAQQMVQYRQWYTQKKPWNLPLPFFFQRYEVLGTNAKNGHIPETGDAVPGSYLTNGSTLSYSKAYNKLINRMGSQSQWAVNLAEQKQSMNMIVQRLTQLRDFTKAVRRANLVEAARVLSVGYDPKHRGPISKKKAWSNTWLEYHFGWAPLLDDIWNAIDTFTDPHLSSDRPISGSGTERLQGKLNQWTYYEVHSTKMGCSIRVDNPNLHLASQLGLVNPLSVAWELVPFSFVADWFGNVGQVLSSYTDFAGLSQVNPYYTTLSSGRYSTRYGVHPNTYDDFGLRVNAVRHPGPIPGPSLAVKPWKGLSPVRGLTAVSLLLQSMK